jgi:hypothetical protein
MNSIAQQAVTNGYGKSENLRAFEEALPVHVQQDQHQQEHEDAEGHEHESRHRLRGERPDEQEHGLEIEEDEHDGHRVVLDGHRLHVARVDRGGAALEGLELERRGFGLRPQEPVHEQRHEDEAQDRQGVEEEDRVGTHGRVFSRYAQTRECARAPG